MAIRPVPKRHASIGPQTVVGQVGFGAFGRLIVQHLAPLVPMLVHDPAYPPSGSAGVDGVAFADLAAVARCPVVVLATPVDTFAAVVAALAPRLGPGTLVVDVGSVKTRPAAILRDGLPAHVDVVGTHPLFGPQSARDGIRRLKIALCPIRGLAAPRLAALLRKAFGLKVIVTTPEEHDREAAIVQGLTHLIAKVLVRMEPLPTRMTTASFDLLMRAIDMVRDDAPEVFDAIERANPYAHGVRRRFFQIATEVEAALAGPVDAA